MSNRVLMCLVGVGCSLVTAAVLTVAGPLDPPAGPIAPAYKTLTEVEPRIAINSTNTPGDASTLFKINKPGSYYLTGNITGKAGLYGIFINADNVTIDLNGFVLTGVSGSFSGIQGYEGIRNTTIRNGTVSGWGLSGIYLGGGSYGSAIGFLIEGVTAAGNTSIGISAGYFGNRGVIARCVAQENGANGIEASGDVLIQSCTSIDNGSNGIVVTTAGEIRDCVSSKNGLNGLVAGNAVVSGCSVYRNEADGIVASSGCLITANQVDSSGFGSGNSGANIRVSGNDNRIEGNNCIAADRGIEVTGTGNILVRNTCSGNTTNWVLVANNYYGPIISRVGAATSAVTGDSASDSLASTHANANFSY